MGESEENKSNNHSIILTGILIVCIASVIATLVLPLMPHGTSHPPQVTITREGFKTDDQISIKYDGGIDDAFVGNFSVTIDNVTTYYTKPETGRNFYNGYHPNFTCVDVKAIDRAVRIYRPIGYLCL
jgi:hypothetical protein